MKILPVLLIFTARLATTLSIKDPSIIIIGAGPAGIAAATRLLQNGFNDILLLEAESRIGGRINSVKFGDAYVEIGAEWCHGEKGNIVYELTKDLNIFRHSDYSYKLYHSSGEEFDEKLAEELEDIHEALYSTDGNRRQPLNVNLGEYYISSYNRSVYEKFGNDPKKLELAFEALTYFLHQILSSEGAFSWFDPSAEGDYKDLEGDLQLNWNGLGYKTILEILMKKYPDPRKQLPIDEKILLNKEVVAIRWHRNSNRRKTTVSCSDGSTYTGDHIIFTPSVGVLKERGVNMFVPKLPNSKLEAIENIGFGAVIKVVMLFSSNWWHDQSNLNFVWSEEDKKVLSVEYPEDPNRVNGRSWLTNLFVMVKVEQNPRVLVAWFTGDMVPVVELLPEETLIKGIYYALDKFLGNEYRIPKIERMIRSQWYANSHFRGVYSFQTIKSKRRNGSLSSEDDLAEPILDTRNIPIIQFAGEATHPYYYSTVHGAIETGYREADRLVNLYL